MGHCRFSPRGRRWARALLAFLLLGLAGGFAACSSGAAVPQREPDAERRVSKPDASVAEDIAALRAFNAEARRALPRLIARGPEILPQLHAALRAPDARSPQLVQLTQVLAAIGDPKGVDWILQMAARRPPREVLKSALLALAVLPQTDASAAFASRIAANAGEAWPVQRAALTYFGLHRDPRGRRWAELLRENPQAERRATALFVLARLGDATALDPIVKMLDERAAVNARGTLLLALAELVDAPGFEARAPHHLRWSQEYKDALRYARYRTTPRPERAGVCGEMLGAEALGHSGLGVRCLLDLGREEDLLRYLELELTSPLRAALLRSEIRKVGYRVIESDGALRIERAR